VCGGVLKGYGWRHRKVTCEDGEEKVPHIRRLKCVECGKHHHELPDIIVPYKRHSVTTIEKIIKGEESSVICEESTIHRIKWWWRRMQDYFKGVCKGLSEKHGVRFKEPIRLAEVVRGLVNSQNWDMERQ